MTKETYYEMCDMLKSEPVDSEIPVEFDDLPLEVQEAFDIYSALQDNWDTMNGNYMGKAYVGVVDIMQMYEVEDTKMMFSLVRLIDTYRMKAIKANKPKSS